jgi:ADP-heptose:LPS heptosyltransferase
LIALIARAGAIGDMIIISPVLEKIKSLGYDIYLHTSKRGLEVYKHSPIITKTIEHDEKIPIDQFGEALQKVRDEVKPDLYINFTESIECNVALHPIGPRYIYPRKDRIAYCNRNYYDVTEEWARKECADIKDCQKTPELYFIEEEHAKAKSHLKEGKFNILWQLSGSGKQKVYPWSDYVMGEILKNHKDIHIITTGDLKCQLLETLTDENITNLSGDEDMRTILCLTQYVDLVVSPDTGVLHASGCYDTPKIGLLGHTTKENITKHFRNDYSLEAECACSPCMRLIYDHQIQCPIELASGAAWCMAEGLAPERVYERIDHVIRNTRKIG